jgi:cytochrome c biogenesis protein CcmG/thiol:disulfide interchange protein DsbE
MVWSYNNDIFRITWYTKKMNKFFLFIPIFFIFIISIFLFIFLIQNKDPTKPPSSLLDENLPNFKMVNLFNEEEFIKNSDVDNKFILINFFASWCTPCKAEHPLFFEIKKKFPNLFILGIDMQDKKSDAIKFLNDDGNPYDYVGVDEFGFVSIEFGVIGLPETFLINESGKIIYKHLGPLTKKIIENDIYPNL